MDTLLGFEYIWRECQLLRPLNYIVKLLNLCLGEPKAIPWSHVTPIKCASDAFFHQDVRRGDVLAWPTNLGWMMGPWYDLLEVLLTKNQTQQILHPTFSSCRDTLMHECVCP